MTDELYGLVMEHFLRISIADGLHAFKTQIPKTKKQALRCKVTALGERECKKKKLSTEEEPEQAGYFCPLCKSECLDSPTLTEDNSIGCDASNKWFHFRCVKLKSNENCLKRNGSTGSTWKCPSCSKNGKGRGKKSK